MARTEPNIIVTGTPGVGKTSHCEELAKRTGLKHISINHIVKERECHDGWDRGHQSFIVDEDKVILPQWRKVSVILLIFRQLLDSLEDEIPRGGVIIDWHACDLFPERWIDLVVVLRSNSTTLYDRLQARKYPNSKIQENLDSEIMEVLLAEARESYDVDIVRELRSDEAEDIDKNVEMLDSWIQDWRKGRVEANNEV